MIVLVTFCSPNKVLITAGDIVRGIVVVLTVGMVSWWVFSAYYRRKFRDYRPPSEELLQFGKEKLFHIYSSLVNVVGEKEQSLLTEKKEEIKNFLLEFSDFDEEEQYEVRQFIWLLDNKIWKCR
ncbi:MAG: hypothetical protein LBG52_02310 [Candidatus Peribacteria bacterium]|nr:hypothetical protein [Candidatus Peribacteria bacterium]